MQSSSSTLPQVQEHRGMQLLLVVLVFRIALVGFVFAHPNRFVMQDSLAYLDLASVIREERRYAGRQYPNEDLLRPPGYPVFVAGVQTVFGENAGYIALVQLALSGLTAWLLFWMGSRLSYYKVGMVAAWVYLLNPNATFWSMTLLSETLFAFELILALALFFSWFEGKKIRYLVASGVVLGLATLTRPVCLYLIPLWVFVMAANFFWTSRTIRRLVPAVLLLICASAPVLGWYLRNNLIHDRFTLSASAAITLKDFIAADALADALNISRLQAREVINSQQDPVGYSFSVIKEYPVSFARVTARGLVRTLLGTQVGTWMSALFSLEYPGTGILEMVIRGDLGGAIRTLARALRGGIDALAGFLLLWGVGYALAVYTLATLGVIRGLRRGDHHLRIILLLAAVTAAYLILIPGANGDARFRVPASPMLALLAGLTRLERFGRREEAPSSVLSGEREKIIQEIS